MPQTIAFGFNVQARQPIDSRLAFNGRPWLNPRVIADQRDPSVPAHNTQIAYEGLIAVDTDDNTIWYLTNTSFAADENGWTQINISGLNGADGADGRTIISGIVNPVSADGNDGDFYINTDTSTIFGPKDSGNALEWGTGTSLVGPQGPAGSAGAAGAQGIQGTAGTNGTNGTNGSDGADGTDGQDGATGPAGPIGPIGPAGPAGADGADSTVAGPQAAFNIDIFMRSATLPATPPSTATYDASTSAIVNIPSGWSDNVGGTTGAEQLYESRALYNPATDDTTTALIWDTPFIPGSVGPMGLRGLMGDPGADSTVPGPTGPKGESILFATVDPLALTGIDVSSGVYLGLTIRDIIADSSTGTLYPIIATSGTPGLTGATIDLGPTIGSIRGATGADGTDGTNGRNGTDGADGAIGAQGPVGPTGPTGTTGPIGPIGLTGAAGADANMVTANVANPTTALSAIQITDGATTTNYFLPTGGINPLATLNFYAGLYDQPTPGGLSQSVLDTQFTNGGVGAPASRAILAAGTSNTFTTSSYIWLIYDARLNVVGIQSGGQSIELEPAVNHSISGDIYSTRRSTRQVIDTGRSGREDGIDLTNITFS